MPRLVRADVVDDLDVVLKVLKRGGVPVTVQEGCVCVCVCVMSEPVWCRITPDTCVPL